MEIPNEEKLFQCPRCGKIFRKKQNLDSHLLTYSHTGEKKFECPSCGRRFSRLSGLKAHQLLHTGERSYICGVCKVGFARADVLRIHSRIHTGERPYTCIFCEKKFTARSHLMRHIDMHTGERPYSCRTCGSDFRRKSTLKLHYERSPKCGRRGSTAISVQKSPKNEAATKRIIAASSEPLPSSSNTGGGGQLKPEPSHETTEARGRDHGRLNGGEATPLRRRTCEHAHICEECNAAFENREDIRQHTVILHTAISLLSNGVSGEVVLAVLRSSNLIKDTGNAGSGN